MPPRSRKTTEPTPDEETAGQATENTSEDPAHSAENVAGPQDDPKAPADDEPPAADASADKSEQNERHADLCLECFPHGWPDEATSAGCSHGTWNRTL